MEKGYLLHLTLLLSAEICTRLQKMDESRPYQDL